MKKVLLFAAAAFCTTLAMAQKKEATSSSISFGIKAGVNISKLSASGGEGSGTASTSSKVGLNAGAFATFHVSSAFAVQPELTWSTLGGKQGDVKIPLNYLTVPVLAKYAIANSGFSLYAGPQIGFLLTAKSKVKGQDSEDIKDGFKSTDFAGVAGLEFEIPHTQLNISGRYQFGLTNIAKESGDAKLKNNGAIFTVGYRFN